MDRLENKQILGVIDATVDIDTLAPLTLNRPVASLPFSGRYRLIDFMLSNMVHAGIDSVGIFSHHLYNSLKGHIGSGKVWDLDRKNGGLFFYVQDKHDKENTQLILQHNQEFFIRAPYQYVIIAPSHIIGRIPILDMLKMHREKEAPVTQVVYAGKGLPIYLLKRQLMVQFLDNLDPSIPQTLMGFVEASTQHLDKNLYQVNELLFTVDSLTNYYKSTMDLLTMDNWNGIFSKKYPVLTTPKDEPPTKYLSGSHVTGTMVANGCLIEGEVTDSVISRGVRIGKNTVVKNCIIMPKVEIGDDCVLENVIVDKEVTIEAGAALKGNDQVPLVVPKNATVYKEWI
ncbi:MAG: sugar phosphate nucleotidyltransferase [Defluviitaleaceae bacterium]|nr:sugar phosphate nucleotidyltransferase [Defluviitaleaceae bacterium]